MADPKYQSLFSYYNSSSGINPVVGKLPYNLQEKWTSHAFRYKMTNNVTFPPFTCLVEFIRDISKIKNDPGFIYSSSEGSAPPSMPTIKSRNVRHITTKKTELKHQESEVTQVSTCPLHKTNHSLNDCRGFKEKSYEDRRKFLRENNICFKCCTSYQHKRRDCSAKVRCYHCGSESHCSALHVSSKKMHTTEEPKPTTSICTQICKSTFPGKSCAKVVLVNLHRSDCPSKTIKVYAIPK